MNRFKIYFLFFIIGLTSFSFQPAQVDNATIKSAYIYHLSTYVKWENLPLQNEFLIGVIGNAPDARISIPANKKIADRAVRVIKTTSIEQAERLGCRVVYLAADQQYRLAEVSTFVANRKMLTVSASGGFINNGVMVNLFQEDGKVYFEINQKAIKSANIKLSAQIYSLAKRILK